jgi:polysaccharide export outer membrane protein
MAVALRLLAGQVMRRSSVLLLALALTAGCAAGSGPPPAGSAAGPGAAAAAGAAALPLGKLPAPPEVSRAPAAAVGDYRLAPGDRIGLQVHGQPDLARTLSVSQAGTVTVPLVGEVQVGGRSTVEVERAIADGLSGRYLLDPRVTVAVVEFRGRQVAVLGAVAAPGPHPLRTNATTMLAALAQAGGARADADRLAYLVRARPRTGEPQPLAVDLDALGAGDERYNVVIEAGDSLFVPQADTIYVAGEVGQPGAFRLRRGATVATAVTEAGGTSRRADLGDVRILRRTSTGDREQIDGLDLDRAMAGDPRHDLALAPQDVVVVPVSGAKSAAYGFLNVLKSILRFSLIAL